MSSATTDNSVSYLNGIFFRSLFTHARLQIAKSHEFSRAPDVTAYERYRVIRDMQVVVTSSRELGRKTWYRTW